MTFDELPHELPHELHRCEPWTCAECRRERRDEEACEVNDAG